MSNKSRTAPQRTRDRSNDRLQEISLVAANLFCQKGYAQTTTKDIARACNISVGTLYYYITSKRDFIKIFVDIHAADIDRWARKINRELRTVAPEKLLRKAVREFVYGVDRRKDMVNFWFHTSKVLAREELELVFEIEHRTNSMFQKIIEIGCKQGVFHTSDPAVDAISIHTLCQMWALKNWFFSGAYTPRRYAKLCADTALAMVQKKGAVNSTKPAKPPAKR